MYACPALHPHVRRQHRLRGRGGPGGPHGDGVLPRGQALVGRDPAVGDGVEDEFGPVTAEGIEVDVHGGRVGGQVRQPDVPDLRGGVRGRGQRRSEEEGAGE